MARWIGKLMNALCRPLVRRVSAELAPHHERMQQDIAAFRHAIEPVPLPLVVRSEIEHTQQLPLAFLRDQGCLVFVGFRSKSLSDHFGTSRCVSPPVSDEHLFDGDCLVFLDEYHFLRTIRELATLFSPVRRTLMLPFRGTYMPEEYVRTVLHQLGFAEVFILDYVRTTDSFSITAISHALPVSSLPVQVSPRIDSETGTRWLVASRFPTAP